MVFYLYPHLLATFNSKTECVLCWFQFYSFELGNIFRSSWFLFLVSFTRITVLAFNL